ncbi:DUF6599 family protein [Thermodesulfobacteriota bacterium]
MSANKPNLPKTVGAWSRPDTPRVIDSTNIFAYMNGAGELYLGYRFRYLDVYEYTADQQKSILVELYFMETSNDAFGLLSLDWGGEPMVLNPASATEASPDIAPPGRALYGRGLLRIWSDTIYARVMAERETSESREAVLSLGRAIVANQKNEDEPRVLNNLPEKIASDWTLRRDRIGYFRSHLVLNSLFYLSHQNILDLDLSTEAVTAPYEKISDAADRKRSQLLLVKYENPVRAREALNHFHEAYLPEYEKTISENMDVNIHCYKIEDGWLGYQLHGRFIALVFGCPDQEVARFFIKQIQFKNDGE